jgi:hypothetical protein
MRDSLAQRLNVYLDAATLAAHATFIEGGFRVRDLRFFTELFRNWSDDFDPTAAQFQNTQLSRYLDNLVAGGFARCNTRSKTQTFRLSRLGLLELLNRLTSTNEPIPPAQSLFRLSFLTGYKPWLEQLVRREGTNFPPALALELAALLDIEAILSHEIRRLERALGRLERRISDAQAMSKLTKNRLSLGVPFADVVEEVEARYPYELNSMKPLRELIASIAPDQRIWELQTGSALRASMMWQPQREILREILKQMRALKDREGADA